MAPSTLQASPHRRFNPLLGEWVLVSPHRAMRPWLGSTEAPPPDRCPAYDPACYLCPGNVRANGSRNPAYPDVFAFDNDFPALAGEDQAVSETHPIFRKEPTHGRCRVLCFSPRHDLTLARMQTKEIRRVVDLWIRETETLGATHRWVQVFENKGDIMGCSNPHPHGQIWAGDALPTIAERESACQLSHLEHHGQILLCEYLALEMEKRDRVVVDNEAWVAVVPYWAVWPFETLVLPRRHLQALPDLDAAERDALADLLRRLLVRYDNLFRTSFPYTLGWHGAPFQSGNQHHWQLHAHIFPPLLRSATVRKFMVGYELLAEAQRDLTPEQAAIGLHEQSELHYLGRLAHTTDVP